MKPKAPREKFRLLRAFWKALGSLWTTLICLSALIVIVVLCTLAEARLGVFRAVDLYVHSAIIYAPVAGLNVPVLPGGALIGALLLTNLIAVQTRLEVSWRKAGLWIVHLGLILLFLGEFLSGLVRHESQMAISHGRTMNYAEDARHVELALIDRTDPLRDQVYSISEAALGRRAGLGPPELPLHLRVHQFAERYGDEQVDDAQADVEVGANPLSNAGGRWIVSTREDGIRFDAEGRRYELSLRRRRRYLPVSIKLDEFKREIYPGTDIPRSFSSRVEVAEAGAPPRPALISMNNPLRVKGLSFYQSGFAEDDRVSILEVVDNPAWIMPYLACAFVSLGMLIHFARRLSLSQALRS